MNPAVALDFFNASLDQLTKLLDGVPHERWAEQPAGGGVRNHPAWTVPHLCCGHGLVFTLLGRPAVAPPEWNQTMGGGTIPVADLGKYPEPAESMRLFREGHERVVEAVHAAPADTWTTENPHEPTRPYFPTIGHALGYMLMLHEAHHIGQLAAWKRAAGLAAD